MDRIGRLASVLMQRRRESAFYDIQERKKYTFKNRGLALNKYVNREDVFGSFTDLPKLGINPSTIYDTPIGVYSYPISYMVRLYNKSSAEFEVPFAPLSRYIHVFSVKDLDRALMFNIDDTNMVTEIEESAKTYPVSDTQEVEIYEALRKASVYVEINANKELSGVNPKDARDWYKNFIVGLKSPEGAGIGQFHPNIQKAILNYFTFVKVIDYNKPFFPPSGEKGRIYGFSPVNAFSKILYDVSLNQALENTRFPYEDRLRNLPDIKILSEEEYQEHKKNTFAIGQRVACNTAFVWNFLRLFANNKVKWTAMMRQMGFIGAVDNDTGTIHESEPTQAVFFNPSSIKVIEVMRNEIPEQYYGSMGGTQSLLGQWAESSEKHIKGALVFIRTDIDNLDQIAKLFPNRGYTTSLIFDFQKSLENIMKYIGWLNLHAKNHPEWSRVEKSQIESGIKGVTDSKSLRFKKIKSIYDRIMRSLQERR